jgi:fructosamine-3-kinase
MVPAVVHQYVLEVLQAAVGTAISSIRFSAVGGGSINDTYQVITNSGNRFFVKLNSAVDYPSLFVFEQQGLEALAATRLIRTPGVIATGVAGSYQVLVLEWIEQGLKSTDFWESFGRQLAALHGTTQEGFGFAYNNYMGALPQYNEPMANWCDFFIQRRLEPQLKLALDGQLMTSQQVRLFEGLYKVLPSIFPVHAPGLLHGDLWSGNFLCSDDQQPVLIDPAVYYGHPAVDMAMTTLFGGFDRAFYDSYFYYAPPVPNYREQWEVCNLYPLLIHLNLFGKGYLPDILRTIERY